MMAVTDAPAPRGSSLDLLRRKLRYLSLMLVYVFVALLGLVIPISAAWARPIECLAVIFSGGAATYWAVEDSRIRGKQLGDFAVLLYFFTWPVASLIYLLMTRGWQGATWWFVNVAGIWAVAVASFILSCTIVTALGGEVPWAVFSAPSE